MSGDGYGAVVKAAAKLACSPIVDRPVREKAQAFLEVEIDRWSESPERDEPEEPEVEDGPKE